MPGEVEVFAFGRVAVGDGARPGRGGGMTWDEPRARDYQDYDAYRDARHEWRYEQSEEERPWEAEQRMAVEDERLRRRSTAVARK